MKRCGECGAEIKNYHPSARYERVTVGGKDDGVVDKILCQLCATAVANEFRKFQPGKLYIE